MSQPHPPRPEDQPAQPSQQQDPPTRSIPVVTPGAAFEPQQGEPRPAFLSAPDPGAPQAPPPSPPTTAVLPAAGAPQTAPGAPSPAPAGPVWPQPGPPPAAGPDAGAGPDAAAPPHSTGPMDFVPGFSTPAPPDPPAGSTAVTGPGDAGGAEAGSPGAGTRARAAGRALGARLGSGLQSGRQSGRGLDRRVLSGLGVGVLALVVLELGLTMDPGNRSLWSAVPSWSAFATVAAVVALVPLLLSLAPQRLPARTAWRVGAAGAAGLGAFWVLIGLPVVASDRGFLLTAALALAAGAVWLAPGREG